MSNSDALFRFKSKNLDVEFEGPEEFVAGHIEMLEQRMLRDMGTTGAGNTTAPAAAAEVPASPPAEEPAEPGPSLEEFFQRARSREGRGALQETILIFAYFLREYRGDESFSIENLNYCFSVVGATPPKSLANTLGIMKRNQKFFASAARRGHYTLTDKGMAYVKRLIGDA